MTKTELMERLASYPEDEQLAVVWFDQEEIGEHLTSKEWENKCDDLFFSDTIKNIAEDIMNT